MLTSAGSSGANEGESALAGGSTSQFSTVTWMLPRCPCGASSRMQLSGRMRACRIHLTYRDLESTLWKDRHARRVGPVPDCVQMAQCWMTH